MYAISGLFLLFVFYSFAGWCAEVVLTAIKQRRFVNRGVMNGPIVPLYGLMAVVAMVLLEPRENNLLVFVAACIIVCAAIEVIAGVVLERLFGKRWWDYSDRRYNLKGYICLEGSLSKGILAAVAIRYLNPLLAWGIRAMPSLAVKISALVFAILLLADGLVMVYGIHAMRRHWKFSGTIAEYLQHVSENIGGGISDGVLNWYQHRQKKHLVKAFPHLATDTDEEALPDGTVFASGVGFYKLFWLFFIGAFVGDIVETIFVFIASGGVLMSRSSLLYGPFSVVWGLGAALLTMVLKSMMDKSNRYIFISGALLGGVYEYMCSVVTELMFGKVFWDYSKMPFNLNGRVNLLYCVFWGVAAVVWVKVVYPRLSGAIEKIPPKAGKILTRILVVFLAADIAISCMALYRMQQRENGAPATNVVEQFLDEQYPDDYLHQRYQNMKFVD